MGVVHIAFSKEQCRKTMIHIVVRKENDNPDHKGLGYWWASLSAPKGGGGHLYVPTASSAELLSPLMESFPELCQDPCSLFIPQAIGMQFPFSL